MRLIIPKVIGALAQLKICLYAIGNKSPNSATDAHKVEKVLDEILFKDLSYGVVGAAMEAHTVLGPGFLESVYQKALAHELSLRSIPFDEQVRLSVGCKGLLVGDYLAATGYELEIILNFGEVRLKQKCILRLKSYTPKPNL